MHYAISKYNPEYRIDGIYTRDEWTDYSEIGKIVGGQLLSYDEYLTVENRYLSMVNDLLDQFGIDQMDLRNLEVYGNMRWIRRVLKLYPKTKARTGILSFIRGCLRNKYWGELYHPMLIIYTSYDYYLQVVCDLSEDAINRIASNNQLFYQAFSDEDFTEEIIIDDIKTKMILASKDKMHTVSENAIIELISKLPDLNKRDHGYPLLNYAVELQLESVVRYLLEQGVDVNAWEVFGRQTALHVAAKVGNVQIAQILLSYGADVNSKDKSGITPLMMVDQNVYPDLFVLLTKKQTNE